MGITAFTNQFGEFTAHLGPGNYYIHSMAMGFIPEFYDNVPNIQQAILVTLNDEDSLNFDITLAPFVAPTLYTLSGNVTDNLGAPLFSRVTIYPVRMNTYYQHHFVKSTFTDSLGNYSISVREGDTVVVFCKPFNRDFMPEYYDNKQTFADADRIPVAGDVTGINFSVDPLPVYENGISGVVQNDSTIGVDAHVAAFNLTGNHMRRYRTVTDSLGNYAFSNMIPGEYILLAVPQHEYMPTFFRYDGQPTLNWRDADSVIMDLTGVVTGIDFTVHPRVFDGYAIVTGVVKDNSGNYINGATIFAVDNDNNMRTYAISNSDGQFVLEGLVPGNYKVMADKFGFDLDQYFNVTLDYNTNLSQNLFITLIPEGVTSIENETVIKDYVLNQNYPNPFNPVTNIQYSISSSLLVTLKVIDILGKEVATLVNEVKPAGKYNIQFDAASLTSGVYFYKMQAGNFVETKKMIVMK